MGISFLYGLKDINDDSNMIYGNVLLNNFLLIFYENKSWVRVIALIRGVCNYAIPFFNSVNIGCLSTWGESEKYYALLCYLFDLYRKGLVEIWQTEHYVYNKN